jgi:hypothetical protein
MIAGEGRAKAAQLIVDMLRLYTQCKPENKNANP